MVDLNQVGRFCETAMHDHDLVPGAHQLLDRGPPNESRAAQDDDSHRCILVE
jgi:hypothetical protein